MDKRRPMTESIYIWLIGFSTAFFAAAKVKKECFTGDTMASTLILIIFLICLSAVGLIGSSVLISILLYNKRHPEQLNNQNPHYLSSLQKTAAQASEEVEKLNEKILVQNGIINDNKNTIALLEQQLKYTQNEIETSSDKMAEKTAKIDVLNEKIVAAEHELDTVTNQLHERIQQLMDQTSIYQQLQQDTTHSNIELGELVTQIAATKDKIDAYQRILQGLENDADIWMQRHHEAVIRNLQEINHGVGQLQLSVREKMELEELGKVLPLLSNPAPLNKVIYEMYYRTPLNTMINELGLQDRVTGIYRIYQIIDGIEISYVGQSVDVGERWKQHLKRLIGCEPATGIKFYKDERIEIPSLKWELIERCDTKDLNNRERYWIDFYNSGSGWNSRC